MPTIDDLKTFIDYAEKNRKYAKGTAQGRRAALKMFENELNDDERNSVELFEDRFEKIYSSAFQRNKTKVSASSWETYKKRVKALFSDFTRFGNDAAAFNAWDATKKVEPKAANRPKKSSNVVEAEIVTRAEADVDENVLREYMTGRGIYNSDMNRVEFFVRSGFKVSFSLPIDLSQKEADRLKHMIDGMVGDDDKAV